MPVVKNSVPSKLGADIAQVLVVDHRPPPIIGLASRRAIRAARGFEYWNLAVPIIGLLWSLKFVSLEFPFPPSFRNQPRSSPESTQNQAFSRPIKPNQA
jgi:hypothetical protein